jgi:hypothetical protein
MSNSQDLLTSELEPVFWQLDTCFERDDQSLFQVPSCGRRFVRW